MNIFKKFLNKKKNKKTVPIWVYRWKSGNYTFVSQKKRPRVRGDEWLIYRGAAYTMCERFVRKHLGLDLETGEGFVLYSVTLKREE